MQQLLSSSVSVTPPANQVSSFSIGQSTLGKEIMAYKIGNGSIGVAIVGGMNGTSEQAGIDMVNAAKNAVVNSSLKVPANITLYFIPEINADQLPSWNGNEVDINRNFNPKSVTGGEWSEYGCSLNRYKPYDLEVIQDTNKGRSCKDIWGTSLLFPTFCQEINPQASGFYCAKKSGNRAESEPETQAIVRFITNPAYNIKAVLSYRAPREEIATNNATADRRYQPTEDLAIEMAKWLGLPYQRNSYFTDYPLTGQFMDWLNDLSKIGVEIEMPQTFNSATQTKHLNAIGNALNWISSNVK